jgi:hypothetical protein
MFLFLGQLAAPLGTVLSYFVHFVQKEKGRWGGGFVCEFVTHFFAVPGHHHKTRDS